MTDRYNPFVQTAPPPRTANGWDGPSLQESSQRMLSKLPEQTVAAVEDAGGSVIDGNLTLGKFVLSPIGLIITDAASQLEWQAIGKVLKRIDSGIQWMLGDWMLYGERSWGSMYQHIAKETGFEVGTLRNCVWLARRFELSLRRDNLSYGHHKLVAKLSDREAEKWLDTAEANGWSVAKLREALKPKGDDDPIPRNVLLEADNKLAFESVWTAIEAGGEINGDDIVHLKWWIKQVEGYLRG